MLGEAIRDFYGRILGWVQEEASGNKIYRNFGGVIVARYNKSDNTTRDFYGRIIGKGDIGSSQLFK